MRLFVFLLALSATKAISFFELVVEEWETWKLTHDKEYDTQTEEKFRLKIFMENKVNGNYNNIFLINDIFS